MIFLPLLYILLELKRVDIKKNQEKGVTYFLHSKEVTLRGGKLQTIYFFAKDTRPADAIDELPSKYMVVENPRNGFLTLKKK